MNIYTTPNTTVDCRRSSDNIHAYALIGLRLRLSLIHSPIFFSMYRKCTVNLKVRLYHLINWCLKRQRICPDLQWPDRHMRAAYSRIYLLGENGDSKVLLIERSKRTQRREKSRTQKKNNNNMSPITMLRIYVSSGYIKRVGESAHEQPHRQAINSTVTPTAYNSA